MSKDSRHNSISLFWISIGLHLIWLAVFVYIFYAIKTSSSLSDVSISSMFAGFFHQQNPELDAIKVASEMGRLDFVALSLTVLGVVLALSALVGFPLIRHAAISQASEEVSKIARDELPRKIDYSALMEHLVADQRFITTLMASLELQQKKASDDNLTPESADRIAEAFGDKNGEEF